MRRVKTVDAEPSEEDQEVRHRTSSNNAKAGVPPTLGATNTNPPRYHCPLDQRTSRPCPVKHCSRLLNFFCISIIISGAVIVIVVVGAIVGLVHRDLFWIVSYDIGTILPFKVLRMSL